MLLEKLKVGGGFYVFEYYGAIFITNKFSFTIEKSVFAMKPHLFLNTDTQNNLPTKNVC